MATLAVEIPEEKHRRLKALAKHRHMSTTQLIDELLTHAISESDNEVQLRSLAAKGDPACGLALLDKLDAEFHKR